MSDIDYIIANCFTDCEHLDTHLEQLSQLVQEGHVFEREQLKHYDYMKLESVKQKIVDILDTPIEQPIIICKHIWEAAGHKKNKDRIHNKGNGKGKYKVYKCTLCKAFKRRYLK